MDDELKKSDWDRAEFYVASARNHLLKFTLRQSLAAVIAIILIGLAAVSLLGLLSRRPEPLLILITALASYHWWKFMRPMFRPPTALPCPVCSRNTATLPRRKTSHGHEWDLACTHCSQRIETGLGND